MESFTLSHRPFFYSYASQANETHSHTYLYVAVDYHTYFLLISSHDGPSEGAGLCLSRKICMFSNKNTDTPKTTLIAINGKYQQRVSWRRLIHNRDTLQTISEVCWHDWTVTLLTLDLITPIDLWAWGDGGPQHLIKPGLMALTRAHNPQRRALEEDRSKFP